MNILDYIDWRGDVPFRVSGFNEVDNLIFSTLAYVDFSQIPVPQEGITLAELQALYRSAGIDQSKWACDPGPLLDKVAGSARFRNVLVKKTVNVKDSERQIQFCAATFEYEPERLYIAFQGTDNTLIGWREDCNFSYLEHTPGQREAVEYVNQIAEEESGEIILGGHSKGGNFAVYAAAFCHPAIYRDRIRKIYSNDGPGFNSHISDSEEYLTVLEKVDKIVPESSLVGLLLSGKEPIKVITSSARGLGQHNPYTWNVVSTGFEVADDRSFAIVLVDQTMDRWMASLSPESKQRMIDTFFGALESLGIHTLREINRRRLAASAALFKAIAESDVASRVDLLDSLKKLLLAGRDTVTSTMVSTVASEARKALQTITEERQLPTKKE